MARSDDSASKLNGSVSALATLDASIERGLADADAGRVHDLEVVAEALDAKYAE
jgi:predicted transcriptional regulator